MKEMALATESELMAAYDDDKVAEKYVEHRFDNELNRLLHDRQVRTVNRWIQRTSPRNLLEIAPGPGRLTRDIRCCGKLTCLEYNEAMIRQGKRACSKDVKWIRGNAFDLPFEDSFDFVYTIRFIRHFHLEDRDRLYEQIRRVLRGGGIFIFDAVNETVSAPLRRRDPASFPIYDKLYRSESELRIELQAAGFETVEITPVQRWIYVQYPAQVLLGPRSRWLCRGVIRTFERLRRGPALEWIVTCRA